MEKFLVAALAAIALSAAFFADAVAAYPPNDWQLGAGVLDGP
jgi:opacity protein-like surface antigen